MTTPRLAFRVHAIQRMFERQVVGADVRRAAEQGETIEARPDDRPYPTRLMLGWQGSRPLHVVVADNVADNEVVVIAVYEPDLERWAPGFRGRRPR